MDYRPLTEEEKLEGYKRNLEACIEEMQQELDIVNLKLKEIRGEKVKSKVDDIISTKKIS